MMKNLGLKLNPISSLFLTSSCLEPSDTSLEFRLTLTTVALYTYINMIMYKSYLMFSKIISPPDQLKSILLVILVSSLPFSNNLPVPQCRRKWLTIPIASSLVVFFTYLELGRNFTLSLFHSHVLLPTLVLSTGLLHCEFFSTFATHLSSVCSSVLANL